VTLGGCRALCRENLSKELKRRANYILWRKRVGKFRHGRTGVLLWKCSASLFRPRRTSWLSAFALSAKLFATRLCTFGVRTGVRFCFALSPPLNHLHITKNCFNTNQHENEQRSPDNREPQTTNRQTDNPQRQPENDNRQPRNDNSDNRITCVRRGGYRQRDNQPFPF